MTLPLRILVTAALLAGCTEDLSVESRRFVCQSSDDCLPGFACSPDPLGSGMICVAAVAAEGCSDGLLSGAESAVDCGGGECPACENGRDCRQDSDCASGFCDGVCKAPSCDDGELNGGETDVDCGGPECPACAVSDCDNTVEDGSETDVDCGGSACGPCSSGRGCLLDSDCASGRCVGSLCQVGERCGNQVQDPDESDVDCGGPCEPCAEAQRCRTNSDCQVNSCPDGLCILRVPLAVGTDHVCALRGNGVRCWGKGRDGRLGRAATTDVGDDERVQTLPDVMVGGPVAQVAAGDSHTCALLGDGSVRCWGNAAESRIGGSDDAIGDDEPASASQAIDFGGGVTAIRIGAGDGHSCALVVGETSRSVRCWGVGLKGQLGYGAGTTQVAAPRYMSVALGGDVDELAVGPAHSCAIVQGGAMRCWGDGDQGALGLGSEDPVGSGTTPPGFEPAIALSGEPVAIAAGEAVSCAVLADGTMRCWGDNASGQLGVGRSLDEDLGDDVGESPVDVDAIAFDGAIHQVAVGAGHVCARYGAGRIRCWGDNSAGQLGSFEAAALITYYQSANDVPLPGGVPALFVAAGGDRTCVLAEDLRVYCWGDGANGALGQGDTDDRGRQGFHEPVPFACVTGFDCFDNDVCANGTCEAPACGDGQQNGSESGIDCGGHCASCGPGVSCFIAGDCDSKLCDAEAFECLQDSCFDGLQTGTETDVDCGGSCVANCGLRQRCEGHNDCVDATRCLDGRCQLPHCDNGIRDAAQGETDRDCGGNECAPCALGLKCVRDADCASGRCMHFSPNAFEDDPRYCIADDRIAVGGSHACVIREQAVRCWGNNTVGQLGYGHDDTIGDDETLASYTEVVSVGGPVGMVAAGANHTCAMRTDGKVSCWGANSDHQLAQITSGDPVGDDERIDALNSSTGDWYSRCVAIGEPCVDDLSVQLAGGGGHTCALTARGAIRCFGANAYGQLGVGSTEAIGDDDALPYPDVLLGGDRAVYVAAGLEHTCAVLADGTIRCWGRPDQGRLGYANQNPVGTTPSNAPSSGAVDLGTGTKSVQVVAGFAHSCALTTRGQVFCWGRNASGQLGLGHTNDIGDDEAPALAGPVPLRAPAVRLFSNAQANHSCARLEDGSLWCWGDNSGGQLGIGSRAALGDDEAARMGEPSHVPTMDQVGLGRLHSCGLGPEGVYCWGSGSTGRLGQGNVESAAHQLFGRAVQVPFE